MQVFNWDEFVVANSIDTTFLDGIVSRLPFLNEEVYIAGGAITDTILGKKPKDIDIFFANETIQKEFAKRLIEGTWHGITEAGEAVGGKHHVLFIDKQILMDASTAMKIQLVGQSDTTRFGFQTIEKRVENADFTVTQFVYDGTNLYCGNTSISDLKNLLLIPNNLDIFDFQERVDRYVSKGFIKNPLIALIEYGNTIAELKKT